VCVCVTRLTHLSSYLSWGSMGLKEKDLFLMSTKEVVASFISFSTCTNTSTCLT